MFRYPPSDVARGRVWNAFSRAAAPMVAMAVVLACGQVAATAQTLSWIDAGIQNQSCGGAANIAFNPATSRLYATGWTDAGATLVVIDDTASAVSADRERLVSHEVIPLPGFRFFNCFDHQAEQGQYLAVNPATNRIYMLGYVPGSNPESSPGDLGLAVVDGDTNSVIYITPFGGEALFPYTGWDVGIAVNPATNRIYFAGSPRGDGPVIVAVDGATLEVVRRYSQPSWVDPSEPVTCGFTPNAGIAVNPNTNRVYFTGTEGGRSCHSFLGVIDEATGDLTVMPRHVRSTDPVEFFSSSFSRQVTVDTHTNTVFVRGGSNTRPDVDEVIAVDEATGEVEVVWTGSVDVGRLGNIAVNGATRRLYVHRGLSLLSAVDLATRSERIAVELPSGWSFSQAYSPRPVLDENANRLYVLSDEGWINVVDLGTSEIPSGANTSVQADAASITFESVTDGGTITVTPIADPSTAGQVPGGFAISELVAYEIAPSPSLSYSGAVTTCFQIANIDDPVVFASLRVLHMEDGALVDRTSSHNFLTRSLCAVTSSFSPFYVARTGTSVKVLFNQTRAYRVGSTVPIRVQMHDETGANISSASLPLTTRGLTSTADATVLPVTDAGHANPDATFRYDPTLAGYVFNLKTTGLPIGRHVLSFWADVDRSFFFSVAFDLR